jgi:beta-glucosidase
MDAGAPIESRIDSLLAVMSRGEKIGQMHQIYNISEAHADELRAGGIGSSLFASGAWAGNYADSGVRVEAINAVQHIAVEQSRLGVPLLFARDVIHGYRTMFPIPLGQAASWDPAVVREGARIAATEASADGLRWTFAPMMDIARDPRWGRVAEGYGEDPFLASRMAEAAVEGFQGEDLSAPDAVAACAKHFLAYGLAEGGRDYNIFSAGPRLLRDIYLPPFYAAVRAGVAAIMTSFTEIDGIPTTIDAALVTGVLREEWGFDGVVVTDWDEINELLNHGVAAERAEAARLTLAAGTDMEMVGGCYRDTLDALVERGEVAESLLDRAVRRILRLKFRLGLFERPYRDESVDRAGPLPAARRDAARRAAVRSAILLVNDGVLPIEPGTAKRILLTGQMLAARAELLGTWTLDARPDDTHTIEEAMRRRYGEQALDVRHFPDEAVRQARFADVVIAFVGEHPLRGGEANSTTTLDLPPGQLEQLKALHAIGTPLVVVILAGRPLAIPWAARHAAAVLYLFHPGIEGGRAIAELLAGDASPGGRCPMSFPRSVGQVPIYYNVKNTVKPQDPRRRADARYADSPDTPLFPFGYGLGYTRFVYDNLRLAESTLRPADTLEVSVEVHNVGERDGEETVQAYVRDLVGSATRPLKELKAFARVAVPAHERRTVLLRIPVAELAFTGANLRRAVEPGEFHLWVGPNAAEGQRASFRVIS